MTDYELLGGIKLQQREDFEAAVFYTCPTCSATITVTAENDALIDHLKWHEKATAVESESAIEPTTRAELIQCARDIYYTQKESGALEPDLKKSAQCWAELITEATVQDEDFQTLRASILTDIRSAGEWAS